MSGADVDLSVATDVELGIVRLAVWEDDWLKTVGEIDAFKVDCIGVSSDVPSWEVDRSVDGSASDVLDVFTCSDVDDLGLLLEAVSIGIVLDGCCEIVDNADNVTEGDELKGEGNVTGEVAALFVDWAKLVVCEAGALLLDWIKLVVSEVA